MVERGWTRLEGGAGWLLILGDGGASLAGVLGR